MSSLPMRSMPELPVHTGSPGVVSCLHAQPHPSAKFINTQRPGSQGVDPAVGAAEGAWGLQALWAPAADPGVIH